MIRTSPSVVEMPPEMPALSPDGVEATPDAVLQRRVGYAEAWRYGWDAGYKTRPPIRNPFGMAAAAADDPTTPHNAWEAGRNAGLEVRKADHDLVTAHVKRVTGNPNAHLTGWSDGAFDAVLAALKPELLDPIEEALTLVDADSEDVGMAAAPTWPEGAISLPIVLDGSTVTLLQCAAKLRGDAISTARVPFETALARWHHDGAPNAWPPGERFVPRTERPGTWFVFDQGRNRMASICLFGDRLGRNDTLSGGSTWRGTGARQRATAAAWLANAVEAREARPSCYSQTFIVALAELLRSAHSRWTGTPKYNEMLNRAVAALHGPGELPSNWRELLDPDIEMPEYAKGASA